MGCRGIPAVAEVDIDDLPMVVDRPEQIPLASTDLEIGLVHAPSPTDGGAVPARRGDEAGGEGAHPGINGARVDADAALSQPFGHISIAEAIAEIPADGEHDDVLREPIPTEGGLRPLGQAAAARRASVELPTLPIPSCLDERFTCTLSTPHQALLVVIAQP